jgi:hypothetical protein
LRKPPVRSLSRANVVALARFRGRAALRVTIVCGGPGWRAQVQDAAMRAFLRRLDPFRVASVCGDARCYRFNRRGPIKWPGQ